MKTTIQTIIIIISMVLKGPAVEAMPAFSDTVFILLENDNKFNNEIEEGINARGYSVYGFVRDAKPRDFIDSLGYHGLMISLAKDTFAVYDKAVCEKRLAKKMISLYDLRDSLKANMNLNYYRKHMPPLVYRPEDMTFLDPAKHVLVLIIPKKKVYYLRRIGHINYFYKHTD